MLRHMPRDYPAVQPLLLRFLRLLLALVPDGGRARGAVDLLALAVAAQCHEAARGRTLRQLDHIAARPTVHDRRAHGDDRDDAVVAITGGHPVLAARAQLDLVVARARVDQPVAG